MPSNAIDNPESEHLRQQKREAAFAAPKGSAYGPLFALMANEHNLTLLDSEMEDICQVVERMRGWQPKEGQYSRWVCANCGATIGRKYRRASGLLYWTHQMSKGKAGHCCNCPTPTPNAEVRQAGPDVTK